jgi:hypothetical protein
MTLNKMVGSAAEAVADIPDGATSWRITAPISAKEAESKRSSTTHWPVG